MDGHDAVVHFAAETPRRPLASRTRYAFVRTNCFGTNVLCDVARQVGVEQFLHISTDEVYGTHRGRLVQRDRRARRRARRTRAAKAGSDLIALSYVTTHGLPVVVTRCSNNFGPYQFPEKVIPLFTTNLLDGKQGAAVRRRRQRARLDPRRGPQPRRPPGARSRATVGEVYNIGAGNEITNRELTYRLLELTRPRRELHRAGRRPPRPRPPLLGQHRQGQRARLDDRARRSSTVLAETVAWYRDNRWLVGAAEGAGPAL